jgi:hypothetical protein
MSKKWISLIFIMLFVVSLSLNAAAVIRSTSIIPSLSFSGTTANCKVVVSASGKSINATLQLWCGTTLVKSWSSSGTSRLVIRGTYNATSGQSYTLRAVGTIGGISFTSTSITKTCP